MATLNLRKKFPNGAAQYEIVGVRSSAHFNKGMFAGEPPATIEVTGVEFAAPGSGLSSVNIAERAQKAQERADKAKARAEKSAERAAKLAAKAASVATPAPAA